MLKRNVVGIDHVALQLPDLEEGLRFFGDWLGFRVKFEVTFEGQRVVMLQAGKIEIEMWQGGENVSSSGPAGANGVHHLAIQIKRLDHVMACAREAGVKILNNVYEPTKGIREAIVQGPGGVRVQFVEQNVPLLIWRSLRGEW